MSRSPAPEIVNPPVLREIFDPFCHEYKRSSIVVKCNMLKQAIRKGETIYSLLEEYEDYYTRFGSKAIANCGVIALCDMLTYALTGMKKHKFTKCKNNKHRFRNYMCQ